MVNGKTPLYLTLLAAALFVAALLSLQPYSAVGRRAASSASHYAFRHPLLHELP